MLSRNASTVAVLTICTLLISGCIPLSPPSLPPITELPKVSGQGCVINVIKTSRFGEFFNSSYITFGTGLVAKLGGGEYTSFWVPEGNHTIGVIAQVWGIFGCGVYTCGGWEAKQIRRSVDIECHFGKTINLGVTRKANELDGFYIQEVTDSDENFLLKNKSLVPAGKKQ